MACLLRAAASSAFAQHISVGIKAGVPLTDLVTTNSGDVRTSTQTKRYTIGPVVDIGLLLGFSVEFGAMYKRFDQQSLAVTTTGYVIIDEENSYLRIPTMPIADSDLMAITIPSDADHRRSEATLGCPYNAGVIGIRQSFCC